jgi:hypothetical protein
MGDNPAHTGPATEGRHEKMSTRPDTVSAEIDLNLVVASGPALPVKAGMTYDPADPYAVKVGFHTGASEVVEWTFARSLLTDGVTHPVGDGDVQVWPATSTGKPIVCISLTSPSGRALFEAPLTELVQFLTRTYSQVPTGSESDFVDVEAELALLLWSEPEA